MGETQWGTPGAVGYHGPRCPICKRMIESDWEYCAWCGASKEKQAAFETHSKAVKEGLRKSPTEKATGVLLEEPK